MRKQTPLRKVKEKFAPSSSDYSTHLLKKESIPSVIEALNSYHIEKLHSLFVNIFSKLPRLYEFEFTSSIIKSDWLDKMLNNGFKILLSTTVIGLRGKTTIEEITLINKRIEVIVIKNDCSNIRICCPLDISEGYLEKITGLIRSTQTPPKKKTKNTGKIFMLNVIGSGMKQKTVFSSFKFRPFTVDVKKNYNEDFLDVHKHILKRLREKNGKGLVLLHGDAGTGKTFYMRQLCKIVGKKILYIPSAMIHSLTDPSFMTILKRHKNSILVVEDADNIVRKRDDHSDTQTVSTILNLSDGMLNDVLNIQVVLSFNTKITNIDPALMREDRLIAEYKFGKLTIEKAQELSDSIGFKNKIKTPLTLAQIYTQNEARHLSSSAELQIGFNNKK